jgi:NADH-quinone oxidoreductase subunit G
VRQSNDGTQIVRADNRDKSGLNGDFLCAKGRFGFDFVDSPERLSTPLVRNAEGKLEPATWDHALRLAGSKFKEIRDARGGAAIGVIGSNRTTNEENYLLQKFARTVLNTNNIDHKHTAGFAEFAGALAGHSGKTASLRDIASADAVLLVGGNPTEEHPLLAWTLRTGVRLNRARLYVVNSKSIKLERQAKATQGRPRGGYKDLVAHLDQGKTELSKRVLAEESLVIIFGEECGGQAMADLIAWGLKRLNVSFALLGDYANSRGAADMGLSPDLLPGYISVSAPAGFTEYAGMPSNPGLTQTQMVKATDGGKLGALLVVGANPLTKLAAKSERLKSTFLVVQDLFLTETARLADVVLPAASLYEKSGTVTNTFGDVQLVKKAADRSGVKADFEILVRLADAMGADVKALVPFGKGGVSGDMGQSRGAQAGEADQHSVWLAANNLEPRLSPFDPLAVLDEIARLVPGYKLDRMNLFGGNAVHSELDAAPGFVPISALTLVPAHDTLFTSGTLGRYSSALRELEKHKTNELTGAAAD